MSRSFTDRNEPWIRSGESPERPPSPVDCWGGKGRGPLVQRPSQAATHNLCKRSLDVELFPDRLDLVAEALVFLQLVGDLLDRMQRRRVVAPAEGLADRRQ